MALPNAVWGEAPAGVLDQTLQVPAQFKLDASGNVTGLVGPDQTARFGFQFRYDLRNYGIDQSGRTVLDATTPGRTGAGNASVSSSTVAFEQSDVGAMCVLHSTSATAGYSIYSGQIVSVESASSATVSWTGTVSAIASGGCLFVGHDQSEKIASALSAAAVTGGRIHVPAWMLAHNGGFTLPEGVYLEGEARNGRGNPLSGPVSGSALICTQYTAGTFITMSKGCTIANIAIDGANKCEKTVAMDTQCTITQANIGRALTTTLTTAGSTLVDGRSEIYGAFRGTALQVAGDSGVHNCLIYGSGDGLSNVYLNGPVDDCQISGNHFYKGGWGVDLNTVTGPNMRILQWNTANSAGGTISGNTFDTAQGNHIDLDVTNSTAALPMKALTIAANQFYQPQSTFTDNTYSVLRIKVGSGGANNVQLRAFTFCNNAGKGFKSGGTTKSYKSIIDFDIQATYGSIVGMRSSNNTFDNCNALYTGTYTAGTLPAEITSSGNGAIAGSGSTTTWG